METSLTGDLDDDDRPVFDIALMVRDSGVVQFQVRVRAGVPLDRIAAIQPGSNFPLRLDRDNSSMAVIDLSRA